MTTWTGEKRERALEELDAFTAKVKRIQNTFIMVSHKASKDDQMEPERVHKSWPAAFFPARKQFKYDILGPDQAEKCSNLLMEHTYVH